MLGVTVITIFSGVVQPFNEICVSVMVTPEGQLLPSTKLPGVKKFVPVPAVFIEPLPPKDVDQVSNAPGVAETSNEVDVPAQSEAVLVLAIGGTFTVTVEFTAGPLQPLRTGLTVY